MAKVVSTTMVRGAFVDYAKRSLGWKHREAVEAFEHWLNERRAVAMGTFACSFVEPEDKL